MIKKFLFSILIVTISFTAALAQNKTKEENKLEDPDNLASQYFSQVMGVAVNATSNLKLYKFIYESKSTSLLQHIEENDVKCTLRLQKMLITFNIRSMTFG